MTVKQKAFCDYYLETGNATESARKAGYSQKTANRIASENLAKPVIKQYIQEKVKELDNKRIASAEEVLQFLTRMMRGEEKDAFGLDASNQDKIKAGELLGKRYRLFTDKVEIESPKPINITVKKASEKNGS